MTKHRSGLVVVGDDRADLGEGGVIYGYNTPRIHSPLNDLPSRGSELSQFATEIGLPLLPWQEWIAEHAHKVKPDGRWKHSNVCVVVARQNGKSTLMMVRIMAGMYLWNDGLQIGSAHRLTTSLETFRHIVNLIESNDRLAEEVKKIRWEPLYRQSGERGGAWYFKAGDRIHGRASRTQRRGRLGFDEIHNDEREKSAGLDSIECR
jgi:hypothetical protein